MCFKFLNYVNVLELGLSGSKEAEIVKYRCFKKFSKNKWFILTNKSIYILDEKSYRHILIFPYLVIDNFSFLGFFFCVKNKYLVVVVFSVLKLLKNYHTYWWKVLIEALFPNICMYLT